MKKMMQTVFALVVTFCFVSNVDAAANSKLLDYAKSSHTIAGESVKLSAADVKRVETFLSQNEISDSEAKQIIAKADEMIAVLDAEGQSDYTKLSAAKKQEIKNLASEAAQVIGATFTYDNTDKTILISKDGNTYDFPADPYLKQTGSSNLVLVGIAGIAVIGIAAALYRKRNNA